MIKADQANELAGVGKGPMARMEVRSKAAFSLIELLTAVSIMVVIIYALYSMFAQTQKALRANITQVDVLESGRAASEMVAREVEQLAACSLPQTVNFYAGLEAGTLPFVQFDLDEKRALRTNLVDRLFFLSRQTNKWFASAYRVIGKNGTVGTPVGTLYRFTASTNYYALNATNLISQFTQATLATNALTGEYLNFNRVADGVVHFRVTAYDPDGRLMGARTPNMYPSYRILRRDAAGTRLGLSSTATNTLDANVVLTEQRDFRTETDLLFASNAVPGYVELELGVLEPVTFKQYQALPPAAAAAYLKKQAGKVHLFRQRIPIRTVLQ